MVGRSRTGSIPVRLTGSGGNSRISTSCTSITGAPATWTTTCILFWDATPRMLRLEDLSIATGPGKRGRKRKGMSLEDRPILEGNVAGIDIGAREIYVAVPPDRDEHPVRVFSTFTEDLEEMAHWLVRCGVTTVAMESTGVYWIPPYDVLERHGVKACLVDFRHSREVSMLCSPRVTQPPGTF
jgi:hypothetical protein